MSSKKERKTKRCTSKVSITPDHRITKVIESPTEETSSWRIFKIIGEFVSGYEFLKKYPLSTSIFGSSRRGFEDEIYKEAQKLVLTCINSR